MTSTAMTPAINGNTKLKKKGQLYIVWGRLRKNPLAVVGMVMFGILVFFAIFAPLIVPYNYAKINVLNANQPPSLTHPFGTDQVGRDIFSRILIGTRYSLTLGILSVLVGTVVGVFLGSLAGYFGKIFDDIIMRISDIFQSIPNMVLNVAVACVVGTGVWQCIFVLCINCIPVSARLIRNQILKIRTMEYIEAAGVANCSTARIIVRHLIPNSFGPILVNMTMSVGGHIMAAAGLAYLGLGVQPPTPEWGAMLSEGRQFLEKFPWMCIFPGVFIMITVLSLNLFGDGLRDALDPKLKK
jgi:ABC-type dipeptide/oligopeptide/nickel transport system permease subunit